MSDSFYFKVCIEFTIEIEHKFDNTKLKNQGGIVNALENLGKDLISEFQGDRHTDIYLMDFPKKKNRINKYPFSFEECRTEPFNEDEVAKFDESVHDFVLDEISLEMQQYLENIGYSVLNVSSYDTENILFIEYEENINPLSMAKRLRTEHVNIGGDYILSKKGFKTLARKKVLRRQFIDQVGNELRNLGYLLINLTPEKEVFGITSFEAVLEWNQTPDDMDFRL